MSLLWDQPALGMSHPLLCGGLREVHAFVTTGGAEAAGCQWKAMGFSQLPDLPWGGGGVQPSAV